MPLSLRAVYDLAHIEKGQRLLRAGDDHQAPGLVHINAFGATFAGVVMASLEHCVVQHPYRTVRCRQILPPRHSTVEHRHGGGSRVRNEQDASARNKAQAMGIMDSTQLRCWRLVGSKKLVIAVERHCMTVVVADGHPLPVGVQRYPVRHLQLFLHEQLGIQMGKTARGIQQMMGDVMGKAVAHPKFLQVRAQIAYAQTSRSADEFCLTLTNYRHRPKIACRGQAICLRHFE